MVIALASMPARGEPLIEVNGALLSRATAAQLPCGGAAHPGRAPLVRPGVGLVGPRRRPGNVRPGRGGAGVPGVLRRYGAAARRIRHGHG